MVSLSAQSTVSVNAESVEYSIFVVVPVILPSLPPTVVGITPARPEGASCTALLIDQEIVLGFVVLSLHL